MVRLIQKTRIRYSGSVIGMTDIASAGVTLKERTEPALHDGNPPAMRSET